MPKIKPTHERRRGHWVTSRFSLSRNPLRFLTLAEQKHGNYLQFYTYG